MDERMMQENRCILAPKQAGKDDLAARGRHKISTAYHQRDVLPNVIDGHRKLVGPMSIAVPDKEISALLGWCLRQTAKQRVLECFRFTA